MEKKYMCLIYLYKLHSDKTLDRETNKTIHLKIGNFFVIMYN